MIKVVAVSMKLLVEFWGKVVLVLIIEFVTVTGISMLVIVLSEVVSIFVVYVDITVVSFKIVLLLEYSVKGVVVNTADIEVFVKFVVNGTVVIFIVVSIVLNGT